MVTTRSPTLVSFSQTRTSCFLSVTDVHGQLFPLPKALPPLASILTPERTPTVTPKPVAPKLRRQPIPRRVEQVRHPPGLVERKRPEKDVARGMLDVGKLNASGKQKRSLKTTFQKSRSVKILHNA